MRPLSLPLSALLRAALAAALALLAPACLSVPEPGPDDWLAVGFRTPEQTFDTFRTAFAGDRPGLEYRCLSEGFKRAISPEFTELAYREYRAELRREEPATKFLALARVLERTDLAPDRVRFLVRVKKLWIERRFEVELVKEYVLRVQHGADVLLAERVEPWEWPEIFDDAEEHPDFSEVFVPHVDGIHPSRFSEILFAADWKIDALRAVPEP